MSGVPVQLGTSRNVIYVDNGMEKNQEPEEIQDDETLIQDMVCKEGVCQKIARFIEDTLQYCSICKDNTECATDVSFVLHRFLKDSIYYYLATGFVPFRFKKINGQMLPFVLAPEQLSWKYGEADSEDMSISIDMQYVNAGLGNDAKGKEKLPRIFFYPFSERQRLGLLYPALVEYVALQKSREYQIDYMHLNRTKFLLWGQRKDAERHDVSKTNVSQILNVSESFRSHFDDDAAHNDDMENQRGKTQERMNFVQNQMQDQPIVSKYCASVFMPDEVTGSVHSMQTAHINIEVQQKCFVHAALDAVNLPHTWYDSKTAGTVSAQDASTQKRSQLNVQDNVPDSARSIKQTFQNMLSFVFTIMFDSENHAKVTKYDNRLKKRLGGIDSEYQKAVNILNLYMTPSCTCTLQGVQTRDVSLLREMHRDFIVTNDDFESAFRSATGLTVDAKQKKLHELEFKRRCAETTALIQNPKPVAAGNQPTQPTLAAPPTQPQQRANAPDATASTEKRSAEDKEHSLANASKKKKKNDA